MLRMKSDRNAGIDNGFRKHFLPVLTLCTAAVVMSGLQNSVYAQLTPFKITGEGIAAYVPLPGDEPAFHCAVGTATHLGEYYGDGMVRTDMFTGLATAAFSSAVPFIFTAANGDDLAFHYGRKDFGAKEPGEVTLTVLGADDAGNLIVTAEFIAEFNPVLNLCTGRFKKVIGGSFKMTARTEPFVLGARDPVEYSWDGTGFLDWENSNND